MDHTHLHPSNHRVGWTFHFYFKARCENRAVIDNIENSRNKKKALTLRCVIITFWPFFHSRVGPKTMISIKDGKVQAGDSDWLQLWDFRAHHLRYNPYFFKVVCHHLPVELQPWPMELFLGVEPEKCRGDPVFTLQDHRTWEPVTWKGQPLESFFFFESLARNGAQ